MKVNNRKGGGIVKSIFTILLCFPVLAWGQQQVTDEMGNPIVRDNNFQVESNVSDDNLDEASGFENATTGARENATQSEKSSDSTKMLGMIMGAALVAACIPLESLSSGLGLCVPPSFAVVAGTALVALRAA